MTWRFDFTISMYLSWVKAWINFLSNHFRCMFQDYSRIQHGRFSIIFICHCFLGLQSTLAFPWSCDIPFHQWRISHSTVHAYLLDSHCHLRSHGQMGFVLNLMKSPLNPTQLLPGLCFDLYRLRMDVSSTCQSQARSDCCGRASKFAWSKYPFST